MGRTDWIERLTYSEIAEVEAAILVAKRSNRDLAAITAEEVSLPTLGPHLQDLLDEVLNGRGFVLIKGLPVERWSKRDAAIAFLVIGVHLGNLRMQNAEGHLLGHVRDLGRSSDDPNTRIYQTRERQTHHTDSSDVVGLLCLRAAKSGGLSSLVSSTTIFNEMLRRRPDLLSVLFDPIETDRRGEVPQGSKPYFNIPIFNYSHGLVSAIYQRQYIESARRFEGVEPLSSLQIEALDLLDELANDPKLNLMMELQPGDIQLVHNHTILHDLIVDLPDEPIYLNADPARLAQVFGNLLNNSSKYTQPNGSISISARRIGEEAVVTVKDDGAGIPGNKLDSIFDMFTQVDRTAERSQGGLGIGLTLVKRLVEMHGGSIEAKSEGEGKGSEFVVHLPILKTAPHVELPKAPFETEAEPTRRIVIVDDNRDSADSLATLLQITGNETYLAHDGIEAIEVIEKHRPEVVLLDIGLPKLNGHEVCRRVRRQPWGKDIVMIALTGWGQDEDRRQSEEAGFNGHLVKPVDYDKLLKLLGS